MTISVPILGSRAREQLPGTSITLRATGFRGELSRLAGATADEIDPLPLSAAIAGADVMLASRLDMQIEAPARDDAGLRTRSAVATQPQLIVPRRPGIAYALLQTDAEGRSQFVLPLSGDAEEADLPARRPFQWRRTSRLACVDVAGPLGARCRLARVDCAMGAFPSA